MRKILSSIAVSLFLFTGCAEKPKEKFSPIGVWQTHEAWDNNMITITVRPDSVMLFKVEKRFCPGTKYFVSVGKWHVEKDSVLSMEMFTDGRHYEIKDYFPELVQTRADSSNVLVLDMSAKLLFDKDHLYDMLPEGKRSGVKFYDRISDVK